MKLALLCGVLLATVWVLLATVWCVTSYCVVL